MIWYLDIISIFLNPVTKRDLSRLVSRVDSYTKQWIATRGNLDTISRLKTLRVILYRYLAGDPLFVPGFAQYTDGLPRILGPEIAHHIRCEDVWVIRLSLSILQISRVIPGWKKIDLSPIYLPPREEFADLQKEFKLFLVGSRILPKQTQPWVWDNLHPTTRMGPNGPALNNATFDFEPWLARYGYILGSCIHKYSKLVIYLNEERPWFSFWKSNPKPQFKDNPILRRISTVDDKEGKLRVIGIGDYWSQSLLKPYHEYILSILARWKTDLTSGQNISPFGDSSQKYWSVDLTSATDRFPLSLQKEVVEQMEGPHFANGWADLMVGEPFMFENKLYKYNCGQPMGLYSSWAVFALTHHLWIQFSAKRVGKQLPFTDYRLLGDDVVIRDDRVAIEYLELLNRIGVDVSKDKTLVSTHSFEFAKRFFYKDEELTAFPIAGIQNTINGVTETLMVLSESLRRNFPDTLSINHDAIGLLYKSLRKAGVKGFITWDNDFISRLNIKAKAFWCYLTRFQDMILLRSTILDKCGPTPLLDCTDEELLPRVKEFLARGVIQNQTELIFRDQGMMEEISTGLHEHMKEYHILMQPVMIVLQEEYMKLVSNLEVLESNFMTVDWDSIIFSSWISLDVNPTQILAAERRVQAKRAQSKAISLGFKYMKEEGMNPI